MTTSSVARRAATYGLAIGLAGLGSYALLLIPDPAPPSLPAAFERPFHWNQDQRWFALEQRFREAAAVGCRGLGASIDSALRRGGRFLTELDTQIVSPQSALLDSIEENTFQLGPMIGACLDRLPEYVHLATRTRSVVKRQSEHWDSGGRDRLYRLLWGGRAALEEVMLQGPPEAVPALVPGDDEPSATPSTRILGVTVHSGDLLVSRGGAPSSALIAVGNDYPGNFSHVVLVHVDPATSLATIVQSNENGLHATTLEEYFKEVHLRVMVLRLRADLPQLVADPMLPHRAAALALARAGREHTPYDFAIDRKDDSRMYCTEVPAWGYGQVGIDLWAQASHISAPGTRAWLVALGVKHFDTEEPSDLEYNPKLRVVAEWRDPQTLYLDHVDNVVTEAMLEGAARGNRLDYAWYLLPFVRLLKGVSVVLNQVGRAGPVPEGLSATAAGRVLALNHRHEAMKQRVLALAKAFRAREGYVPPEWQLLRFARAVLIQ
jgi:hypothetical protein